MLLGKTNRILYLFSSTKRSSASTFSSIFFCSPLFFVIFPSLSEFMHLNLNLVFFLSLSSVTYFSILYFSVPLILYSSFHPHTHTHTHHILLFLFYCANRSPSFLNFFHSVPPSSNKKSVPK